MGIKNRRTKLIKKINTIQYEPEDLQKAINDCNNKNISPYNRGKPSTFTHDEEKVIVDYFVALSKFWIGSDVPTLQKNVQDYVKSTERETNFRYDKPGKDWIFGLE